ncbi:Thivi_2564 family membrane protein [Novosphingobium sp. Fuku2-ISO-50]|jgi:hypothetical protein|uniref:Thivi_2564 family membrane protein n=1 Tax=Novosphingobium sp. Fuku2-ISO-50 TaxID=1739114 RepID=UPI00076CFA52|nr:Thivi_2564 family membrane protein [Novosphingobium sp. Fuku2-ISO-50]KUR77562.1 hypothetical protein AQZ50_10335 [Novosphingobium sp. Fuku2-ISO-50]
MTLLNIIITLIAVGAILWLINTLIPMDGKIKSILNGVITIAVLIWLLKVFGIASMLSTIHVGK